MVKDLILDNEEVALPGLGTFVTEMVSASFSDRGYTINPPYRKLSFRERQGSDNKLAELYSKANGTDLETSKKIIADFVAGVKDELINKKVVVFPGLGRLRATKENAFFFIPEEDLEIFTYGFGLSPVSLKTHEETPEEVHEAVEKLSSIVSEGSGQPNSQGELKPQEEQPKPVEEQPKLQEQSKPQELPKQQEKPKPVEVQSRREEEPKPQEQPKQQEEQNNTQVETKQKAAAAVPAGTGGARKRSGWRTAWIAAAWTVGAAAAIFVIFIILAHAAPNFIDSILYTPEELEIINTPDE